MPSTPKRSNPQSPRNDPDLRHRFSVLITRYHARKGWSDETLCTKINIIQGSSNISVSTVRNYLAGNGGHPSNPTIFRFKKALGIPDAVLDYLLYPNDFPDPDEEAKNSRQNQFDELLGYMRRQSQLPQKVQKLQAEADAAIKAKKYTLAQQKLEEIQAVNDKVFNDYLGNFAYASEEKARSLAALGALAFVRYDYVEARSKYGAAINCPHVPEGLLINYRRSFLIASNATMSSFINESEVRDAIAGLEEYGVTPNVVSYNTLMNFLKDEAAVRAVFAEMRADDVTPNVVSYNTLMNFLKDEAAIRAVFAEMISLDIKPNEISVTTALKNMDTFSTGLKLVDWCLAKKLFVGRGAFQALYSNKITHLSAEALLVEYHERAFKFDTSLEGPMNQYRKTGQLDQALVLTMVAPHVGAAQKMYREEYDFCKSYFEAELETGNDEDNLYYAYGIAATLNEDWQMAWQNLKIARERCVEGLGDKRIRHIDGLIRLNPVPISAS